MIIDSCLTLEASELTPQEARKLMSRLTFFDAKSNQLSSYRYEADKNALTLPRGAWSLIPDKNYNMVDLRARPPMPELGFTRKLDRLGHSGQQEAVDAMFEQQQGVILRQPGSGKTQIALAFIAACKTRTLVIVHTNDILDQWVQYAHESIPGIDVGIIRGRVCNIGHLTIATVQTLKRYTNAGRKFWQQFGCLIVDECHHVAAEQWEWIVNSCPAYYRFGFTATDQRADGMSPLITYLLGPVIHAPPFAPQVPISVDTISTGFKYAYVGHRDYSPMLNALVEDEGRNELIANRIDKEVAEGHSCLILSRRISHLIRIQQKLQTDKSALLIASVDDYAREHGIRKPTNAERRAIMQRFRKGKIKVLLATQLADEALDVPMLSRVALTFPGKAEGRIIQQIGRGIRKHEGKEDAVIIDFMDDYIEPLRKQYLERKRVYRKLKIIKRGGFNVTRAKARRKLRYLINR